MLEEKKVRQEFTYGARNRADHECTVNVRSIEPGYSSNQEGCAANMRSVLMFEVFLGNFEELVGVHQRYVWEVGLRGFITGI